MRELNETTILKNEYLYDSEDEFDEHLKDRQKHEWKLIEDYRDIKDDKVHILATFEKEFTIKLGEENE